MGDKKSTAYMRQLSDMLGFRFPGKTLAQSFDANENPVLIISDGSPAVGEDNILIRIAPIANDWAGKDALGLTQTVYNPHQIDVLLQKNATTTITTTNATQSKVIADCARLGMGLILWAQADATNAVVAATQIAAATQLADDGSILFPRKGEQ